MPDKVRNRVNSGNRERQDKVIVAGRVDSHQSGQCKLEEGMRGEGGRTVKGEGAPQMRNCQGGYKVPDWVQARPPEIFPATILWQHLYHFSTQGILYQESAGFCALMYLNP